jgi:hypothetical protein
LDASAQQQLQAAVNSSMPGWALQAADALQVRFSGQLFGFLFLDRSTKSEDAAAPAGMAVSQE